MYSFDCTTHLILSFLLFLASAISCAMIQTFNLHSSQIIDTPSSFLYCIPSSIVPLFFYFLLLRSSPHLFCLLHHSPPTTRHPPLPSSHPHPQTHTYTPQHVLPFLRSLRLRLRLLILVLLIQLFQLTPTLRTLPFLVR